MNKRHYEHTLPNIRGSLSNTYDETGYKATRVIELEYSYHVRDFSHNYRGYSDLNDYLCGRKQEQKNAASQVQEIKQKTGQRAAPRQKKGRGI